MSCQTQFDQLNTASATTCPDWTARQSTARSDVLEQVIALLSDAIADASEAGDKITLKRLKPVLVRAITQQADPHVASGGRGKAPADDDAAIRRALQNAKNRVDAAQLTAAQSEYSDWRVEYQTPKKGGVYVGLRHRVTRQYLYIGTVESAKGK